MTEIPEPPTQDIGRSVVRDRLFAARWPLIALALGLAVLWSTGELGGIYAATVFIIVVATVVDYRGLVRLAWGGLGVAIALLVIARLLGRPSGGESNHGVTYRWLNVFGMGIQPSELAKLMVILVLGRVGLFKSSRNSDRGYCFVAVLCSLAVAAAALFFVKGIGALH